MIDVIHNNDGGLVAVNVAQASAAQNPASLIAISNISGGKRITISAGALGMNHSGATMTIGDGSNSRVLFLRSDDSTSDNQISLVESADANDRELIFLKAINGSHGGAVDVLATNVIDDSNDVSLSLIHKSGGNIAISFIKNSATRIGSHYLVVSSIGGNTSQNRLEATVNFSHQQPARGINYLLIAGTTRGD